MSTENTDPGLRAVTAATSQADQHIGANGELVLPDVISIVDTGTASRFGLWLNTYWIRGNFLLRGIAGTGAEWFTFLAGAGAQYPKVSVVLLAGLAMVSEERFADEPILTNTIRYAMESYDPEAAAKIFAPSTHDPVRAAARKVTEEATAAYLASDAYQDLRSEIEQDVQRKIRRDVYASAGMVDEVRAVDAEIVEARLRRQAEHEAERLEALRAAAEPDLDAVGTGEVVEVAPVEVAPAEPPPSEPLPPADADGGVDGQVP